MPVFQTYIHLFENVTTAKWMAMVISAVCIPILYLTKEYVNPIVKRKIKMPFPMELILVRLHSSCLVETMYMWTESPSA